MAGLCEGRVAIVTGAGRGLDVLVNNAGILRDRTIVSMTEDEWDWLSVAQGWRKGPIAKQADGWSTAQIGDALRDLLAKAAPNANFFGTADDPTEA